METGKIELMETNLDITIILTGILQDCSRVWAKWC